MSRASSTTKICGCTPLSGTGFVLGLPPNIVNRPWPARVNVSQTMSYREIGKGRCPFEPFHENFGMVLGFYGAVDVAVFAHQPSSRAAPYPYRPAFFYPLRNCAVISPRIEIAISAGER